MRLLRLSLAPRRAVACDAVGPVTGAIGHRRLVLDQSMNHGRARRRPGQRRSPAAFRQRPGLWAARLYLSQEHMSID